MWRKIIALKNCSTAQNKGYTIQPQDDHGYQNNQRHFSKMFKPLKFCMNEDEEAQLCNL